MLNYGTLILLYVRYQCVKLKPFSIRVRYRSCYAIKVDDVVIDSRLYLEPVLSNLQGNFDGDTGTDGLAGITIISPLNNRVSYV